MVLYDMANDRYICSTVHTKIMNVTFKLALNHEKKVGLTFPKGDESQDSSCKNPSENPYDGLKRIIQVKKKNCQSALNLCVL